MDHHHLVEDVGIALGRAVDEALGDKRGIARFGSIAVPLDDALVQCAVDLSGRGVAELRRAASRCRTLGALPTELVPHFFRKRRRSTASSTCTCCAGPARTTTTVRGDVQGVRARVRASQSADRLQRGPVDERRVDRRRRLGIRFARGFGGAHGAQQHESEGDEQSADDERVGCRRRTGSPTMLRSVQSSADDAGARTRSSPAAPIIQASAGNARHQGGGADLEHAGGDRPVRDDDDQRRGARRPDHERDRDDRVDRAVGAEQQPRARAGSRA
jgi:hypothetical protein